MTQPDGPAINRAARRRAAREARAAGRPSPRPSAPQKANRPGEPHFMTINHGPDRRNVSCRKITETIVNPLTKMVTLNSTAVEDTIHPVPLAFAPPYRDLAAAGGAKGFQHIWEKLTYAFALPDPAQFPVLPGLAAEDRDALAKYVTGCRKLAGYSAIAHGGGFKMQSTNGNWTVTPDFPDDELTVAAAARFRQLNNQGESTAFTTASDLIIKTAKVQDPDLIPVVSKWRKARGALLHRTIATIICDTLLPKGPRPDDFVSFGNLRPEDLFNTYFYSDFLHVGDNAGQLIDINSEDGNAAYHMFGFLTSMSALAHLYFGFSVLVEHALGSVSAPAEE
ncbi:hypothetical protein NJB1604_06130 [Mycobacterium marinum]|uniref:hypothetical protein n=1 Tax=Mycobacterium marinum TaxID=1781 RepID=UPI0021C443DA|nr:hypothetical protein [Mycobacterium marinum]GJO38634.1 hypothetical protein NJB1604_06130 [Mycobacterium marinum]